MKPPVAKKIPHRTEVHGRVLLDEYHWLRERENPEVIAYLEAENAYTEHAMRHTKKLQERVYGEILARIRETDLSVPVRRGPWLYYSRTEKGKQYPIFCRKRNVEDAAEELLLDQNALAEGHEFFSLGALAVSPDHALLAYSTDTSGDEKFTLRVRDLAAGEDLPDEIAEVYFGVVWANDNRTLLYTTLDDTHRPWRVHRHRLGEPRERDTIIFEDPDLKFWVGVDRTRSGRFLIVGSGSKQTSEVHVLDADRPESPLRLVQERIPGLEYDVDHHDDRFFIVTNDAAVNFKVVTAPVDDPRRANWTDFIPHREQVKVDAVDLFREHLVVYERERGLTSIRIRRLADGDEHLVAFEEPVHTVGPGRNLEFDTRELRFHYTSLITPESVFDYDMEARTRVLRKQVEVLGGYRPDRYGTERLFAAAPDGTQVPISIIYRKDLVRDGKRPLLLYGYGAYGHTVDPEFGSARLSLVDRGMVFAIAHVRGGGLMGRPWYEAGKFLHKKNSFADFIACAEHLIAEGYTSHDRLAIMGGSAGGLLVGAAVNLRPDLFGAVVAQVPFVDVVNSMLDETLPLTVPEYEEWGDPRQPEFFESILAYSPYDNVAPGEYPSMLVTAGLNDPRVQFWEPAKWTAKLRAMKTDRNRLLLKTNMGHGHMGPSGRYDRYREVAFEYAFLIETLRLPEQPFDAPGDPA